MWKEALLIVRNLKTQFRLNKHVVKAVDGVNFELYPGEIVGLVGESGCGKTVTGMSIMRLIEYPGEIINGSVLFNGRNLVELDENEIRKIRGKEIAMIFQDPTTALNPTKTIGWQIQYILKKNLRVRGREKSKFSREYLRNIAITLCKEVGIYTPEQVINYYPHQLSGGMIQRVLIALSLGCQPKLIIADEPTTNLDVTIEAQILKLFLEMQKKIMTSILYISHDLGVISELCERVLVMYAGKIIEMVGTQNLLETARHPYTRGLIFSSPSIGSGVKKLPQIKGEIPDPANLPTGCAFHPRCDHVMEKCKGFEPALSRVHENHFVACHLRNEIQRDL